MTGPVRRWPRAGGRPPFTASLTARGPVEPDEVWDRYVTPARWTSWAPHLTAVSADTTPIRPGTAGRVTAVGVVTARFVVTAVDPSSGQWSWTVRVGPIRLGLVHRVLVPVAEPGPRRMVRGPAVAASATQVDITGPRLVVLAYLPLMKLALHRLVTRDA